MKVLVRNSLILNVPFNRQWARVVSGCAGVTPPFRIGKELSCVRSLKVEATEDCDVENIGPCFLPTKSYGMLKGRYENLFQKFQILLDFSSFIYLFLKIHNIPSTESQDCSMLSHLHR
jgi:hypothetical protein